MTPEGTASRTRIALLPLIVSGASLAIAGCGAHDTPSQDRWIAPSATDAAVYDSGADSANDGSVPSMGDTDAASVTVPANRWVARPLPATPYPNGKHTTGAYDPDDGRLYLEGGDYLGSDTQYYTSYRQETFSLSLAARLSDATDPHAGWQLEYPYCGPAGQVQPKHPDFIGWTWDTKRHVFWMVPGTMVNDSTNCPGETVPAASDPAFLEDRLMTFDPVSGKWSDAGVGDSHSGEWGAVYDPKTDTLIHFFFGGPGEEVGVYTIATKTWSYKPLGENAIGKDIHIEDGYLAIDVTDRSVYGVDPLSGRLFRYDLDSKTITDLGPVPNGPLGTFQAIDLVWDPTNAVLLWHRNEVGGFFAYHPATAHWETLTTASDVAGVDALGRIMVFDPQLDAVVLFGQNLDTQTSAPYKAAWPYLFVYRYAKTGK